MAEILPSSKTIEALLRDGHHLALEGFTHLIPHTAGHSWDLKISDSLQVTLAPSSEELPILGDLKTRSAAAQ